MQQFKTWINGKSYGRADVEFVVLPWFKVSLSSSQCSQQIPAEELEDYMRSKVSDYDSYKQFFMMRPSNPCQASGGVTACPINSDRTMNSSVQMTGYMVVSADKVIHEGGHSLMEYGVSQGFGHSNGVSGSGGIYTSIAYGGDDIMGRTPPMVSFNVVHRYFAGWLTDNDVVTTEQSGNHPLQSLDLSFGVRAVRVPKTVVLDGASKSGHLFFQYRLGVGVQVIFEPAHDTFKDIKMRGDNYLIKTIPVGQGWTDTGLGVSLNVIQDSQNSVLLQLGINEVLPDLIPPTVMILTPANGQVLSGVVSGSVSLSEPATVEWYAIGSNWQVLITTGQNPTQDTRTVADGSYLIQAKATDPSGNVGWSQVVNVMVDNTTIIPPPPKPGKGRK